MPGSLALLQDDTIVCRTPLPGELRTTQSYAPALRQALHEADWSPQQVDLFAVCQGPGSFTGLRIAVTAAKVYAYAIGCEVLAMNTLEVIALQAPVQAGERIWVILDAQRGQLFAQRFQVADERLQAEAPPRIWDVEPWLAQLPPEDRVTGGGLRLCIDRLPSSVRPAPPEVWIPQAATLGQLAVNRFRSGQRQDVWTLVPEYFRPSAAEEKWRQSESR